MVRAMALWVKLVPKEASYIISHICAKSTKKLLISEVANADMGLKLATF